MGLRAMLRPGMRTYLIPLAAGVVLTVSAFLPWVVVNGVVRQGVPDVPGLWVAGLGVLAAVLATLSLITRKNSRHPLLVVGLVALGIMFLAWRVMPRLAAAFTWASPQRPFSSRSGLRSWSGASPRRTRLRKWMTMYRSV